MKEKLLKMHRENECINVRKLPVGTRVALTTVDEHYEFEVGTPKRGVVLVASDGRFWHREKAVVIGSVDLRTHTMLPEIIGQELLVVLRVKGFGIVRTGPVLEARVSGRGYSYKLWED